MRERTTVSSNKIWVARTLREAQISKWMKATTISCMRNHREQRIRPENKWFRWLQLKVHNITTTLQNLQGKRNFAGNSRGDRAQSLESFLTRKYDGHKWWYTRCVIPKGAEHFGVFWTSSPSYISAFTQSFSQKIWRGGLSMLENLFPIARLRKRRKNSNSSSRCSTSSCLRFPLEERGKKNSSDSSGETAKKSSSLLTPSPAVVVCAKNYSRWRNIGM